MPSANWTAYPVRVLMLAPALARVALHGQTASVVPAHLRNQRVLSGRELMGNAPVGELVLVSNPDRRVSETLVRATAIELESLLQRAANFMWSP